MSEGVMKLAAGAFAAVVLFSILSAATSDEPADTFYESAPRAPLPADAREGLDLATIGSLVETAENAEALEKQLNDPERGIHNLDLDRNGQVDFVKVEEFGAGDSRGLMLAAHLADGTAEEVATIDVEKVSESEAKLEVRGAEPVYGPGHYHHSSFSLGDALLLSWLFSPSRPYYVSPWGYGAYPSYYRPHPPTTRTVYRERLARGRSATRLEPSSRSTLSTRHADSVAASKATLRRPLASQRSFGTARPGAGSRGSALPARSGGFGRPSVRQPSSSRSGFRFGK
jgi:hypothetical protein